MNNCARSMSGLTALLLVIALSGCGKSPEEHFQAGSTLLGKRDYKTAILEFKSTLQEQPGNREARLLLGKAYLASEAYADAEKELAKAREQGASYDEVLPALAKAMLKQNKGQQVLALTVPSSSLSPQSIASLQVTRAEALLRLGKRDEADQALQLAKQADPQYPDLLLLHSLLAMREQNKPEAMRLVEQVLQKDAHLAPALYTKALLLLSDNKTEEAERIYQQIIADDANQVRAYLALIELKLRSGKLDEAEKSLQMVEKIAGASPMVKFQRGVLELERGNLKEANIVLDHVLRAMPDYLPAVLAQASVSHGLGHFEQSLRLAQKVLAQEPKSILATRLVAGSQFRTGDARAALATLEPVLKLGVEDARLFGLVAEIHAENKEYKKAMEFFDRAVALDPLNPELITQRALTHIQMGDDSQASANLEKAISLSSKPGKAELALIALQIERKQFGDALKTIAGFEKKSPNNPVTHNLRAAVMEKQQDFAGARAELEKAQAISPTDFPTALGLSRLDLRENNIAAANQRFESVLAKDPNNLMAMLALADLAKTARKEDDYVKWLERAVKAHPEAIKPTEYLVNHYLAKRDTAKAMDIARQVAKAAPESPDAIRLLGTVQAAAGGESEALASFKALVEQNKNSPRAYLQLAIVQLADRQSEQARVSLSRALQLKPDFVEAQEKLIRLELADGKPDAALRIARQMQSQYANSPVGLEREADIYLLQKRYPLAIKTYELALSKDQSSPGFIKLYRAMILSGDAKGADTRLSAWLTSHPKDMSVRRYAAQIFANSNRFKEAIAQYEFILNQSPGNALLLNNLADLYQKTKDPRALDTAEKGYKLAPNHPSVLDTLGWILVEQGQLERATSLLRKAVEMDPKTGVHRYHFGVALSRTGDRANAKKELEAAIASGQNFPEIKSAKELLKTL